MNQNKRVVVSIVIVGLIVVIAGVVGYFMWPKENMSTSQLVEQTEQTQTTQSTEQISETPEKPDENNTSNVQTSNTNKNTVSNTNTSENLKTYSNKDYGFTFQYPSGWTVNDQSFTYQGSQSINVSVISPVHPNLTPTENAVYLLQMGMTMSGTKTLDSNNSGFFKSPFTQSSGGPVKINVNQAMLVGSSEYKQAQKIFDSFLPWRNLTLTWKSIRVEPGPNKVSFMFYPPNWGASEIRFSCQNPSDQVLAAISPARTNVPGYKNISAAYLVQFCIGENSTLHYQGFVKAPLSRQLTEQDKLILTDADLKNTPEYLTAQQIIFLKGDSNSAL